MWLTPVAAADITATPAKSSPAQPGLRRAGALSKAGYQLARAHAELKAHLASGASEKFVPSDPHLRFRHGLVVVSAAATADAATLRGSLVRLGLQNAAQHGQQVAGFFPLARLEAAVRLDSLKSIHAVPAPILNSGSVMSEGDAPLGADVARQVYGVGGLGVNVGVISDSYDRSSVVDLTAADDIESGDLPDDVQVLSESDACGTLTICIDEGRAMLQIVHDLAPAAQLMFHTVLATTVEFANAIDELVTAGADVIVDDVLYLNEPMFQDGIVAQAAENAVASGVAYYSAAGNQGTESYQSPFDNSGQIFCIEVIFPYDDCDPLFERVGFMHDFDSSQDVEVFQDITIPVGGSLSLAFQWDEPWGAARNDHIIVLLSHDGLLWITMSANDNVATGEPWEVLQYTNAFGDFGGPTGTQFKIAITYDDVDSILPPAGLMKTVTFGSGTSIDSFGNQKGTLIGHANAASVAAVGAAYWANTPAEGVSPPLLEPYSSHGGTPILFGANGNRLTSPEDRLQPKFVATDGVGTSFFFNDTDDDGIPEFFGTSAAAPHAAAIAALMLERKPTASPLQLNTALAASAIDMGIPGVDAASGSGLIQADAAIETVLSSNGLSPQAGFDFSAQNLTVTFTDRSTDGDGTLSNWWWAFGDTATSSEQNPVHSYGGNGTYPVTLTVTDDNGNTDSSTQTVTVVAGSPVNSAPTAGFNYQCDALSCTFEDTSSDSDGDTLSWLWSFGDGTVSTDQHPTHSYVSQGRYGVSLQVSDGPENDTASASVRVKNRGSSTGSAGGDSGGDEVSSEKGRKKCRDGIDNDGDGLVDGADPDC